MNNKATPINSELFTKKGTPRKRKPKKSNVYFTQDTENAIIEYVNSTDTIYRERVFKDRIYYAFNKLAENIIHTFKFYYTDNTSITELKHELVALLIEKLGKFNSSKGKAYSYFGTIIKNHLIAYNDKNYNKLKSQGMLDEVDEDKTILNTLINEEFKNDLSEFMDMYIDHMDTHINHYFPKSIDKQTAGAVIELFRSRNNIDIFNKKAIYIYIREMVEVDTSQITKINNKLKLIFTETYQEFAIKGTINISKPIKI